MEIPTILNRKASAAIAADAHLQAQLAQAVHLNSQTSPEMNSEQGTHQPGDHPALYPPNPQSLHPMPHVSPQGIPLPNNGVPMIPNAYMHGGFPGNPQQMPPALPMPQTRSTTEQAPRVFHCSTCQKGFARRSDLARHGKSTRSKK